MNERIYGLVLAAGMARRMGSTKQLLPFGDRTVLQTVVDTLHGADLAGVVVVLGHDADAVLIALGDQPQIELNVVRAVVQAYREGDRGIVIPISGGKRGHPVLINLSRYRDEIQVLSGDEGLKPVMRGHPRDTLEVSVDDEGILRDLDTPEDYRTELERRGTNGE